MVVRAINRSTHCNSDCTLCFWTYLTSSCRSTFVEPGADPGFFAGGGGGGGVNDGRVLRA